MEEFGLALHPQKTRLIEFGRDSVNRRDREGRGKCETFDFLGFTHACGKTQRGKRFKLVRFTQAKRMSRTLAAIKEQLQRRRHHRLGATGRWLWSVVRGWRQYVRICAGGAGDGGPYRNSTTKKQTVSPRQSWNYQNEKLDDEKSRSKLKPIR